MNKRAGNICIILGVVLLCCALLLFLHNQEEAENAIRQSEIVLPKLLDLIPDEPDEAAMKEQYVPLELRDPEVREMTEVEIDGYAYIGYLLLPSLDLELPIMSGWDYSKLRIAPCRFDGSVLGEDLVLMAHNYKRHFGKISRLKPGDTVLFVDMDGVTTAYEVVARDVLLPSAVEEMTAGNYDLTLFTCTYGGKSRVTVYCDIVK